MKNSCFFPHENGEYQLSLEIFRLNSSNKNQSFDLLSYKPSILPPGKNIFPDGEILFTYYKDEQGHYHFTQDLAIEPQILAGVRSCGLKGINLMDAVFSDGIKDSHYLQRREKTSRLYDYRIS
jgi:hypothetical protein